MNSARVVVAGVVVAGAGVAPAKVARAARAIRPARKNLRQPGSLPKVHGKTSHHPKAGKPPGRVRANRARRETVRAVAVAVEAAAEAVVVAKEGTRAVNSSPERATRRSRSKPAPPTRWMRSTMHPPRRHQVPPNPRTLK